MGIADEIKQSFKSGNTLIKLLYLNIAVFLAVKIVGVIFFLLATEQTFSIAHWFAVPADFSNLIYKPWTIFTYMFLHVDFFHILFNMLWFYWFGMIFLSYFDEKKLLSLYLTGGLAGAALYILAFNIFPAFAGIVPVSYALGASASVIAIVIAVSVYAPNHTIHLLLFGPVKLKYIALVTIAIDVLSIASSNAGGHIAHLGGALFGYLFVQQYKKGKNINKGFDRLMDKLFTLFKPKPKIKVTYKKPMTDIEYNKQKVKKQEEVDRILDKIAQSGYDSLTKKEKETLFKNSN
ncbi:MAG: rhomboid family intramembrane serine protease [Bacteroidales bacterium]|jgi:membrane associated rhomboid family serine protease|nr:rhomboid family intramembrane serine protease [Bacteroidales bacterium]